MQKRSRQPQLATANLPFTPMHHGEVEKPFQPLTINDLYTPKQNQQQILDAPDPKPILKRPIPKPPLDENSDANIEEELAALKEYFQNGIKMIEALEAKVKKLKKPIPTSTAQARENKRIPEKELVEKKKATWSPIQPASPKPNNENTEVYFDLQGSLDTGSPSAKLNQVQAPKPEMLFSPIRESTQSPIKMDTGSGSSSINDRMHVMSELLRRIENQLDQIDSP